MQNHVLNDCFAVGEHRLTHDEALAAIRANVSAVVTAEPVPLAAAAGRIVAEAVVAAMSVPPHTNAAVDGFAFAHPAYDRLSGTAFIQKGRATAGHPMVEAVSHGECARIFTGAVIPQGCDTVAMQEDCRIEGDRIFIPAGLKPGANVRRAGEDVQAGSKLFEQGTIIRPQDLAALASIGANSIACYKQLKVGIVASGDEVLEPGGSPSGPGQVYDANTPMLQALIGGASALSQRLGIWPDRRDLITDRLSRASEQYDLIVTTGGASRGDEDHMGAALADLGSRHFWQIAVKPGRPMMFGQIPRAVGSGRPACVVAGLPGNPVAVFVCTLMYLIPLIRRLSGGQWREPRRYSLPAAFSFAGRKPGRREFWRSTLIDTPGGMAVDKFARDGSGLISGLRAADGLIDVPENAGDITAGDLVSFIPMSEFGILR